MGKTSNQICSCVGECARTHTHPQMHPGNTDQNVVVASGSVQRGGKL